MQVNDNPQFTLPEHVPRPTEMMSFPDAIKNVLVNNYVGFNGRASRSEFWWWTLASFCFFIPTTLVDGMIFGWGYDDPTFFVYLLGLVLFLPTTAVIVRRLHDTGQSGWFLLISFIPLVNCCFYVALYIWCIQDGNAHVNLYGDVPTNRLSVDSEIDYESNISIS